MTLKQFIKYFDDTNKVFIYDWNKVVDMPWCNNATAIDMAIVFSGYISSTSSESKLKALYKQHYILEPSKDHTTVVVQQYRNASNNMLCETQVNVRKAKNIFDYLVHMIK